MKNYNSKLKIFISLFLISHFSFLISINSINAQIGPQFLVSWQAESFVPGWYPGKALPTRNSPVTISFELIDNGAVANISGSRVRWYVNDELEINEDDGLGIKSLRINIPDYPGQDTEARISVLDYKGNAPLNKIITIPVANPEVAIDAPYPDGRVKTGSNLFQAIPFFFNIKNNLRNLSVEWSANNQKFEASSENPWLLDLNIDPKMPSGSFINLAVAVRNVFEEMEFAGKSIQLITK